MEPSDATKYQTAESLLLRVMACSSPDGNKPVIEAHVFENTCKISAFTWLIASEDPLQRKHVLHKGSMGLLPDTQNHGLRMRRECRERFPCHRLEGKPLVSDPSMHHGTCVTHVPWCMSGSLTRGGGENVPGIPGACTTRDFTYLVRAPLTIVSDDYKAVLTDVWCTSLRY